MRLGIKALQSACNTNGIPIIHFSSVQSLSYVRLFATPWIAAPSLSITNSQSLLKLMPIESVMPSSHLILCHSLLLLPAIPPSIRVFSNESTLRIRWPKYWSFSFSIRPSNEHPGLISFRMHWLDLLAVQGTLKSLLQHYSSKASIFKHSAFFTVYLSHPYISVIWEKDIHISNQFHIQGSILCGMSVVLRENGINLGTPKADFWIWWQISIYTVWPQNWASLVAQLVKNLPEMQETPVQFLGRDDPLEKG